MATRLFVAAGEASGDRHAAALLDQLEALIGPLEVVGLGGEALRARGARLLADVSELSVIGFSEVVRRLPFFRGLMTRCTEELERFDPELVLLVDYPGFNLRLGRRARARGHRVLYYIAPQVWAWRRDRRPGIGRAVDHLMVVFPFEEELFRDAGVPVTFVGHPLLDAPPPSPDRDRVRAALGLDGAPPLLALLPGSRPQEVASILPPLVEGAARLGERVATAVSRSPGLDDALFEPARRRGFPIWTGSAAALAAAADAALVASGTATLETGLTGTPLGVVYRTGRLNWHLARFLVRIRTVGLVNIAAGGDRVPELLQDALDPEAVERLAARLLFDPAERRDQAAYLDTLRDRLGNRGSARRAAEVAAGFLEAGREAPR